MRAVRTYRVNEDEYAIVEEAAALRGTAPGTLARKAVLAVAQAIVGRARAADLAAAAKAEEART